MSRYLFNSRKRRSSESTAEIWWRLAWTRQQKCNNLLSKREYVRLFRIGNCNVFSFRARICSSSSSSSFESSSSSLNQKNFYTNISPNIMN
ncbi:hypothetical protein MTR_3g056575 [Medicago truncatula]|uniref:Uncharacterized protein n=1 Tax=Medicago truncatula TaxID=3880 RepID=A0A072UVZ1_MEDTR|nr:hypothetical protein MTR_3g056575 [Medicago truncatula]